MLRSAGERSGLALLVCAHAPRPATNRRRAKSFFMTVLDFQEENRGRRVRNGHKGLLVDRADAGRLTRAACLSGANVMTVAPARGRHPVWVGRATASSRHLKFIPVRRS